MPKIRPSSPNMFVCLVLFLFPVAANITALENVLSLERMGAGTPGGWALELEDCSWAPELSPGPLGVGAACIRFDGEGVLKLMSPAKTFPAGKMFAAALWVRSEPAGATVNFVLRDNENERPLALQEKAIASEEWRLLQVGEVLPPSVTGQGYFELEACGTDCTLFLDGLWLGVVDGLPNAEWRPPTHETGVALEPVAPWGVVTGNAPQLVRARVCGAIPSGARLSLQAANTLGETEELPVVAIAEGGLWEKEIPLSGSVAQPFGMLRVTACILDEQGKVLSNTCETLLARVPEPLPGPMPESYFGVHVRLCEPDLEAVSRLGYKWCRIHDASNITKWGYVEPEPGHWIWHDEEVDLARKHGLSILGMFDTAPAWETGAEEGGYFQVCHAPKDIGDWRAYVRQMTGHYAGRIDEWEVWNEPWDMARFFQDGTPFIYVDLLKAAYEEAKIVNPAARIVGIDTYPAFWEDIVLTSGAYPYYDKLSWHRYDPAMLGGPGDGISRVAQRLDTIQRAVGGVSKPILCSEGGPDVGRYHGSFFSFAEPDLYGPWDEGADRYARFILSAIAAGNERYIAYSVHAAPRHGRLTHMMVEPQFLLKPMHLVAAALAYFVDGAPYTGRLTPAPGISAHLFTHPTGRDFSSGPCMVVALHSDGIEPVSLSRAIPEGVRCYDRWANPLPEAPRTATRGIVYLVAEGDSVSAALRDALSGPPVDEANAPVAESLFDSLLGAMTKGSPPLWSLFSVQGSAAFTMNANGPVTATRTSLQESGNDLDAFVLPENTTVLSKSIRYAQSFVVGLASMEADGKPWSLSFNAVQDAPGTAWKLMSMTLLPAALETGAFSDGEPLEPVRVWDASLREGKTDPLYPTLYKGPCSMAAATRNGEYMVFTRADYLVTMLKTVVMWGSVGNAPVLLDTAALGDTLALAVGAWDLSSLALGMGRYTVAATLLRTDTGWKLASLCIGPEETPQ